MPTAACSTVPGSAVDAAVDPAFDDALARIAQLSARLHAVTDLHAPRRTLLGGQVCRSCARAFPCPTALASDGRSGTQSSGAGTPARRR